MLRATFGVLAMYLCFSTYVVAGTSPSAKITSSATPKILKRFSSQKELNNFFCDLKDQIKNNKQQLLKICKAGVQNKCWTQSAKVGTPCHKNKYMVMRAVSPFRSPLISIENVGMTDSQGKQFEPVFCKAVRSTGCNMKIFPTCEALLKQESKDPAATPLVCPK
ncbi:MAG: hypothetical protein HON43_03445 [Alphaproteobacteria bacterium]|jgi:hypothetical protein|nr:hypothetical protein [Alphaproteobacteria bacterium]MBT5389790.1 hypothetical protein [Alphaproteobacteria bacterium]